MSAHVMSIVPESSIASIIPVIFVESPDGTRYQ